MMLPSFTTGSATIESHPVRVTRDMGVMSPSQRCRWSCHRYGVEAISLKSRNPVLWLYICYCTLYY